MLQTSLPRNMLSLPRSASSNSRTTRVLEELQGNLENIQKELENTKAQLESVRDAKDQHERDNEDYIESNKNLRAEIQEVVQVLGSKQQLLDDSKKTYTASENKVKQLKEEAAAARKELDDLKRREHTIEKECRTVENLKEKLVQQNKLLEQSVAQHQAEFSQEMEAQRELLASIQQEIERLKSSDMDDLIKTKMEEQAKERRNIVENMKRVEQEIEFNTKAFIEQVKKELLDVINGLVADDSFEDQVNQCSEAVKNLAIKIK
ncbi:unnamed protein product [Rhizopus stolonifer]